MTLDTLVKMSLEWFLCAKEKWAEKNVAKDFPPQRWDSVSPASSPTIDPMAACKQMSGEEINRATRITPPVQGLSQPYTWPTPTGMVCNSCKVNRIQVTRQIIQNLGTRANTRPVGNEGEQRDDCALHCEREEGEAQAGANSSSLHHLPGIQRLSGSQVQPLIQRWA